MVHVVVYESQRVHMAIQVIEVQKLLASLVPSPHQGLRIAYMQYLTILSLDCGVGARLTMCGNLLHGINSMRPSHKLQGLIGF